MGRKRMSVVAPQKVCAVCGTTMGLHTHEIFFGRNRQLSIQDGYTMRLCGNHHNLSGEGIHFNKPLDLYWKRKAQEHWEANRGTREQFIERYGRSYL